MKIFIVGYYGFKNIGDEAILKVLLQHLREHHYYPQITVLTANAIETNRNNNVLTVNRNKTGRIIKTIKNSDVLVLGGGSLLQDITGRGWTAFYYLYLIFMAKHYGKKVFFLSQGVGPLYKKSSLWLAKFLLNRIDFISVREPESRRFLQKLGIAKKIKLIPDPALLMNVPVTKSADKKYLGVSLRKGFFKDKARLVQQLDQIISQMKLRIIFFSFQHEVDDVLIEKVRSHMKYAQETEVFGIGKTPEEMCKKIGECKVFIGARLHSLIFAAKQNVPFLGLKYDPKVAAFCKIFGMTWLEMFETEFFMESVRNLISHEESLTKLINNRLRNLERLAELGLKQSCEMMSLK
jgi:polysaccharide pyruvyl transferase CsaB